MRKISILQLKHRIDSISTKLTCELARGFSNSDEFDFCYGVLGGSDESLRQLELPCSTINLQLSDRDVVKCTRHAKQVLSEHIQSVGYDIIISHRYKPARLLSSFANELNCSAFASVWHGLGELDSIGRQWLARRHMNKRWHHIGVSGAVAQDLQRRLPRRSNIHIIHNGVNIEELRQSALARADARTALRLDPDTLVLGTIGRAVEVKGHTYLIGAFPAIRQKYPNSKLLIIGGGRLEAALRAQCEALGISDSVIITGTVQEASRFLPAIDVFLMPSLSEGLALAVLEAMSFGIPVLASSVGGLPEALGPGGLLFSPRSSAAISQATLNFLGSSADTQAEYSRYLLQHVHENFSTSCYQERFRELVRTIFRQHEANV